MAEEKPDFDYKPDSQAVPAKGAGSINWTASEYIEHYRGNSWYMLLIIGTVLLAGAIYLLTKDIFAGIVIVALGVIVASVAHRKPRQIDYKLNGRGLSIGDKTYSYNEFRSFAIVRDGPLSNLMLIPLKRFTAPISMFFEPEDEENIVGLLGEHLPMEQRAPDKIDTLSRKLRF